MSSATVFDRITGSSWFAESQSPYLLVDTDLRIRSANAAYETATSSRSGDLVGELLFEAFPDNPADPAANGVARLGASLETVFHGGTRHWMGTQRYDVPDRQHHGRFLRRFWAPLNIALHDGGRTVGALHHVEDVTAVMTAVDGDEPNDYTLATHVLSARFPDLTVDAIRAVLVRSHCVVQATSGVRNTAQAEALATLRLEVLARHPAILDEDVEIHIPPEAWNHLSWITGQIIALRRDPHPSPDNPRLTAMLEARQRELIDAISIRPL